jgi:hypothetical protein
MPSNPALSCEGGVWNGLGGASVTPLASCLFPTTGTKYLSAMAAGPVAVPLGGPLPRPVSALANEVRMPIPAGATIIAMGWDFFNRECASDAARNDGVSIDVVDASGALVVNLAYADTSSVETGGCLLPGSDACLGVISDVAPPGPNPSVVVLPPLPPCSYISIVVWNGGDDLTPSVAYVDPISFNVFGPSCPVPCFTPAPAGPPTLSFGSGGAGCVVAWMTGMPAGGTYLLAVTPTAGAFPTDWFYGIGIGLPELIFEVNAGPPFTGSIGMGSCEGGVVTIGPFCGVPPITLYAVGLGGVGPATPSISAPITFTVP